MRKIITSSVLILLFCMFSGSVFAGDVSDCKEVKGQKALYGLCVAYWKANPKHQDKFLTKFNKKAGPDGPDMPGLDEPDPDPKTQLAVCPCTDGMDTSTWGMVVGCSTDDAGGMMGIFVNPEADNFTNEFTTMSEGDLFICNLYQSPATFIQLDDLTYAEYDACTTQLEDLCL